MKDTALLRLDKYHWDILLACFAENCPGIDGARHGDPSRWREVEEAGLADVPEDQASRTDRLRLFAFARRENLAVALLSTCGMFLAMTNVAAGDPVQPLRETASGTGFTPDRAVLSCLAEAVEFHSWVFRPLDRARLIRSDGAGMGPRLNATRILGFSAEQIRSHTRLNLIWDGWDAIPDAAMLHAPAQFVQVETLEGARQAAAPAFLVYGHFGAGAEGGPSCDVDSNGCAAAPMASLARQRGLLELIERDAAGIWWNRGCVRTRFEAASLRDEALRGAAAAYREETARRLWFLDISVFRAAPVVVAVSCEPSGARMALGFGVGFSRAEASRAAFREMVQTDIGYEAFDARRLAGSTGLRADRRMARWLRRADIRAHRFAIGEPAADAALPQDAGSLAKLLDEMADAGVGPVWFADLTRAENGVPVAKAVCEGLAHYKLRRGCARLASVPRDRGWHCTHSGSGRSDPDRLLV